VMPHQAQVAPVAAAVKAAAARRNKYMCFATPGFGNPAYNDSHCRAAGKGP
jgi:hypothetical protein